MHLISSFWIFHVFGVLSTYTLQEFDTTPSNSEVDPGTTATLKCKVRNRQGECVWLKDGEVVGKIKDKYNYEKEPPDGDCSIEITDTELLLDDGYWQCQVTQASLGDPTLKSEMIKLSVRVTPSPPQIVNTTTHVKLGNTLISEAKQPMKLACVSRKGNPPPELKWFIEDDSITDMANQTNSPDTEKPKTWKAISILHYSFLKVHKGQRLRCVAFHKSYDTGLQETYTYLDVMYIPEIKLEGKPNEDIEEGKSLTLRCVADGNPKASIVWKKSGYAGIYSTNEEITFIPITRRDSGVYSCSARNDVGESKELEISVDVKYKPEIKKVTPNGNVLAELYSSQELICQAEGNPTPEYSWLQKKPGEMSVWREQVKDATLKIENVTYDFEGRYTCEAKNYLNGKEYKVQSEEVMLDVSGSPQIIMDITTTRNEVVVKKHEDATISAVFCADPKPKQVFWEWDNLKLETGSKLARYVARELVPLREWDDCYEAKLLVENVEKSDSRKYVLHIENVKGQEMYAVTLSVKEPVALSMVIGVAVGCAAFLVVLIIIAIYIIIKKKKYLFKGKLGLNQNFEGRRSDELTGNTPTAIPPDALYSAPEKQLDQDEEKKDGSKQYENMNMDKNKNGSKDHVVYADLDFVIPAEKNGHTGNKITRAPLDKTEYAEIQFPPKAGD